MFHHLLLRLCHCLGPTQAFEGLSLLDVNLLGPIDVVAQDVVTESEDTPGLGAAEFAAQQHCCVFIVAQAIYARLEDISFFPSSEPQRLLKH